MPLTNFGAILNFAETIEQEDPDTFADELSNNEGFIGVEERVIESVNEESDDEEVHFILDRRVCWAV